MAAALQAATGYAFQIPKTTPTTLANCLSIYDAVATFFPKVGAKGAAAAGDLSQATDIFSAEGCQVPCRLVSLCACNAPERKSNSCRVAQNRLHCLLTVLICAQPPSTRCTAPSLLTTLQKGAPPNHHPYSISDVTRSMAI